MSLSHYDSRDIHLRYNQARGLSSRASQLWTDALRKRLRPEQFAAPWSLDVGCGTGRFLPVLKATYPHARVVGIDPSSKMLSVARDNVLTSASLVRAASEQIPLSDRCCGLVFMSMVYHHIADKPAALREIHRVLAPGGIFALRTCSRENVDSFLYSRFFPEARAIDLARLESATDTLDFVSARGFDIVAHDKVEQLAAQTPAEYLQRIGLRGTSDLEAIRDDDFVAGMARLEAHCAKLAPLLEIRETLDFLVFRAG